MRARTRGATLRAARRLFRSQRWRGLNSKGREAVAQVAQVIQYDTGAAATVQYILQLLAREHPGANTNRCSPGVGSSSDVVGSVAYVVAARDRWPLLFRQDAVSFRAGDANKFCTIPPHFVEIA